MRLHRLAAVTALAAASPAMAVNAIAPASPSAAAAKVDPAALTAATALVRQLDVRGAVVASMQQQIAVMRSGVGMRNMLAPQPGFVQAYTANRAKFDAALKEAGGIQAGIADKVLRDNSGQIEPLAATAYARNFSAAELGGLSAFYKTPLGKALYERGPRANAEILALSGRLLGPKLDAAMESAKPRIAAALAPLNSAPPPAPKKK